MIEEEQLKKISKYKKEKENLKKRLERLNVVTRDSVRSSGKQFPYIEHTTVIEGINESKQKRKYKKMIKEAERKISKIINNLEYELKKIDDSEIREIIRYRYEDDLTYFQVAMKMNNLYKTDRYTEDSIRMKINRFFEKK